MQSNINNLLKKIEYFYKISLGFKLITKSAINDINFANPNKERDLAEEWLRKYDKPVPANPNVSEKTKESTLNNTLGLYPDILAFAKTVKNKDVANTLNNIAELYKEALVNKKGYSVVTRAISKFIETTLVDNYSDYDYEEDVEPGEPMTPAQAAKLEDANIESFMNKVYGDINNRFAQQRDIERGLKIPEVSAPESEEEEQEDWIESPTGFGTGIDVKDIGGTRARDDGTTGSMSAGRIRDPKDYISSYIDEKNRYVNQLNDITDPNLKKNIENQIKILEQLITITSEEVKMLEDSSISWTTYPKTTDSTRKKLPDQPDQKSKYEEIKAKQKQLRADNSANKIKIRNYNVKNKNLELSNVLNTTRSPKYKLLLEQKKLLNDLTVSKDINKSPEINARKQFIKYIEGNVNPSKYEDDPELYLPTLSQSMIDRFKSEIEAASREKINFEKFDKQRQDKYTEQRKQLNVIQYNKETPLELDGLIFQFSESLSNIKMGIKKQISKRLKENEDIKYKPYKDAITAANNAGDKEAEKLAIKELMNVLNKDAESFPEIIKITEYNNAFFDYLKDLKILNKSEKNNESPPVDLNKLIAKTKQLISLESIRDKERKAKSKLEDALMNIKSQLELRARNKN